MGRLLLRRLCWRNLNTERSRKQEGVLLSVRVQHVCVCVCVRLTHGAAWASVGWGSVVWSCHSELCGSGESRCRSLRRRAWPEACWCPGLEYTTKQSHTQFKMLSRCTQKPTSIYTVPFFSSFWAWRELVSYASQFKCVEGTFLCE